MEKKSWQSRNSVVYYAGAHERGEPLRGAKWSLKIEQRWNCTKRNEKILGQFLSSLQNSKSNKELNHSSVNDWINLKGCFDTILSRVWSWLRMNAGGVLNTFKSNGQRDFGFFVSGGRVSNAWITCLCAGDNSWKRLLIPHNVRGSHGLLTKDLLCTDGFASD